MAEHTRGPWNLVRNHAGRLAIVGPNNNGVDITSDRICNLPHRKHGEGEANARLIAAAPTLYEALKALHDETIEYIRINNLAGAENNQVLQQARAALARVEADRG